MQYGGSVMNFDPKQLSLFENQANLMNVNAQPEAMKSKNFIVGPFIKGPLPVIWLSKAGRLKGKTAEVSLVLWYLAGMMKSTTFPVSNKIPLEFGVDRHAKRRALKQLKDANLIRILQLPGRSPIVTILELDSSES
jgi:hypothetical protein